MKATHAWFAVREGDHYRVPVSAGGETVAALLDVADYERLNGRCLSLGSHGYVQIFADGKVQLLHRWIFGVSGRGYSILVDHKDRNVLDNRRSNLRVTDGSVSNANRTPADGAHIGAYRTRNGRWQGKFKWRRQRIYVGTFNTQEEAAAAVREYKESHCPEAISPHVAA